MMFFFSFLLITNYSKEKQFESRQEPFSKIKKIKGAQELLNEKKPGEGDGIFSDRKLK